MSIAQWVVVVLASIIFTVWMWRAFAAPTRWMRKIVAEAGGSDYIDFGGTGSMLGTWGGVAIDKKIKSCTWLNGARLLQDLSAVLHIDSSLINFPMCGNGPSKI